MTAQWSDTDLEYRSKVYWMTSTFFLQQPDDELLLLVTRHLQALPDLSPVEQEVMNSVMEARTDDEKAQLITVWKKEYVQLVHGLEEGRPLTPPYESVFKATDQMRVLANIRGFYTEAGIGQLSGVSQPEDHIGALLRFMSLLCHMAGAYGESKGGGDHRLSLADHRRLQGAFFSNHILSWVPDYARRLQSHARTCYIRLIGEWLERLVSFEASIFSFD